MGLLNTVRTHPALALRANLPSIVWPGSYHYRDENLFQAKLQQQRLVVDLCPLAGLFCHTNIAGPLDACNPEPGIGGVL